MFIIKGRANSRNTDAGNLLEKFIDDNSENLPMTMLDALDDLAEEIDKAVEEKDEEINQLQEQNERYETKIEELEEKLEEHE